MLSEHAGAVPDMHLETASTERLLKVESEDDEDAPASDEIPVETSALGHDVDRARGRAG